MYNNEKGSKNDTAAGEDELTPARGRGGTDGHDVDRTARPPPRPGTTAHAAPRDTPRRARKLSDALRLLDQKLDREPQ
jgi:hypothetical protein